MPEITPHMESDLFMETVRRSAESMSRDELLMVVHHLTHAYSTQRAATNWAINQAACRHGYST